jgi:protein SCO1/2
MKNKRIVITALGLLIVPILIFYIFNAGKQTYNSLPYLGERVAPDGEAIKDTVYYSIPPFKLVDQNGDTLTNSNFDGSIYIANFFFASCKDICPKMNAKVETIVSKLAEYPQVKFISHTVDPENDSAAVLAQYATKFKAKAGIWYFVTGSKDDIFKAGQGYLLPVSIEDKTIDHSQQLILVDQNRHIRGIYDGLDDKDIRRIKEDIKVLLYDEIKAKHAQ